MRGRGGERQTGRGHAGEEPKGGHKSRHYKRLRRHCVAFCKGGSWRGALASRAVGDSRRPPHLRAAHTRTHTHAAHTCMADMACAEAAARPSASRTASVASSTTRAISASAATATLETGKVEGMRDAGEHGAGHRRMGWQGKVVLNEYVSRGGNRAG